MAECEFREGAVPVLVLLQSDEGRIDLNQSLREEGILAALESEGAILNVMVPGEVLNSSGSERDRIYDRLFEIDGLPGNQRVIGVEADVDADGMHAAYAHTDNTTTIGPTTFDDTPGSLDDINGQVDNINAAFGETENAYVRLAWATGGAAWDVGIIDSRSVTNGGPLPDQQQREDALLDAFSASLADQILDAHAAGSTYTPGEVVAAINYGGPAFAAEGFAADPVTLTASNSASTTSLIDTTSNATPRSTATGNKVQEIFKTARSAANSGDDLVLTLDTTTTGTSLPDGEYVVELLLIDYPQNSVRFDIEVEGELLQQNYWVSDDEAKILEDSVVNNVIQVDEAGDLTAVTKRFQVTATGGDGIEVALRHTALPGKVRIAGVRVLSAPPRVTDVVFGNSATTVSMTDRVAAGEQLNNVAASGLGTVSTVRIDFDQPVTFGPTPLSIVPLTGGTMPDLVSDTPVMSNGGQTATWTLTANLPANFFAVRLSDVTSEAGVALDGEWINPTNINTASGKPALVSGDGSAGGEFQFAFTFLPADFNGDWAVDLLDLDILGSSFGSTGVTFGQGDTNGDGNVDLLDLDILGSNFGEGFTLELLADYEGNDWDVDSADEAAFDILYGNGDLGADLNGDGVVTMDDDDLFDELFGLNLLWT